jgi:ATP-dependent protease ClpP protease subunit
MPSWNELLSEVKAAGSAHDVVRRRYLQQLHDVTTRNVIVYYSGWLQKAQLARQGFGASLSINDSDKNGFMSAIHKLDRTRGLDLLLHTPGGEISATESLVDYLRQMFGTDIRAIVPQIALSAGTMIALSCREILMGKHSSLGPIDPQIGGIPASGIIDEFKRAAEEMRQGTHKIAAWQPIIAKYSPTLIGEAEKAIRWTADVVKGWLITGMFAGEADAEAKAKRIVDDLADHELTMSHARHISMARARELGIRVTALEENQSVQEAVLSVHHACILTLDGTAAAKIIENHAGVAYIQTVGAALIGVAQAQPPS